MDDQPRTGTASTRVPLARTLRRPILAAFLVAALVFAGVVYLSAAVIGPISWHLYLDRLHPMFKQPLGFDGRLALGGVLAAASFLITLFLGVVAGLIWPAKASESRAEDDDWGLQSADASVSDEFTRSGDTQAAKPSHRPFPVLEDVVPELNKSDAHPDDSPRPPIRAGRDLPAGGFYPLPTDGVVHADAGAQAEPENLETSTAKPVVGPDAPAPLILSEVEEVVDSEPVSTAGGQAVSPAAREELHTPSLDELVAALATIEPLTATGSSDTQRVEAEEQIEEIQPAEPAAQLVDEADVAAEQAADQRDVADEPLPLPLAQSRDFAAELAAALEILGPAEPEAEERPAQEKAEPALQADASLPEAKAVEAPTAQPQASLRRSTDEAVLVLADLAPEGATREGAEPWFQPVEPTGPAKPAPSDKSLSAMISRLESGLLRRKRTAQQAEVIPVPVPESPPPTVADHQVDVALEAALSTLHRMNLRAVG